MSTVDLSPDLPTAAEATLDFPDNRLLIDLCGEYDKNLAQVETGSDVQIIRRGNRLVIMGQPDARAAAIEVLGTLYARLEAGKSVEPSDIDRELRMG
ncbi:phosphate starvation-inducible protein PhoH, partial [Planktotalea frisia]|nr:phosphate starvation-inducible protein PhoH [Planktotalea frisia]